MVTALVLASALAALTPAGLDAAATGHLRREFERIGRSAPRHDPALSRAAQAVARAALDRGTEAAADPMALSEAVSDAGAWEPHPRWIVMRGRPHQEALDSLMGRRDLGEEPASHYGMAVMIEGDYAAIAIALTERRAVLDPFPRSFEAVPARASLCGTLGGELRSPELYVTLPSGAVDKVRLSRQQGAEFCAPLSFKVRGRHSIEVLARGPRGPEVAALFFVDAGEAKRRGSELKVAEPTTVEAARAAILARVNALRAAHGLSALAASERLDRIAQAYSDRMGRENFFAHLAPDGSDMKRRLQEGRYPYRTAGENLGLASGPLSAHFGIEHSPGHRRNLLDPGYTELGLGVSLQTKNGRPQAIVTELLALPLQESTDPIGDAYRQIAQRREARKLPRLSRSQILEAIATEHATRALSLNLPESKLPGSEVHARVFKAFDDVTRASVDLFVADDPAQLPSSRNLDDGRNQLIGIGAARGDSPTYGVGKYWVVVIYAARE